MLVHADEAKSARAVPGAGEAHATGAAVDVTLVGPRGVHLRMEPRSGAPAGREVDACGCGAEMDPVVMRHRAFLAAALQPVGFVNCPDRWWHWSFGDRHWALSKGESGALYGAVPDRASVDER